MSLIVGSGLVLIAGVTPGLLADPGAEVADPRHGAGEAELPDHPTRRTRPTAEGDGRLVDGSVGVQDDDQPAISGLDPALLAALRSAAAAAAVEDDIELRVTSGWRSPGYQQHLFDQAVAEHGSVAEASRWVLPPDRSRHVSGDAVDVGPTDAAYWMAEHGADHGLCQVYANEIWHYELLVAPGGTCPALLPDSSS